MGNKVHLLYHHTGSFFAPARPHHQFRHSVSRHLHLSAARTTKSEKPLHSPPTELSCQDCQGTGCDSLAFHVFQAVCPPHVWKTPFHAWKTHFSPGRLHSRLEEISLEHRLRLVRCTHPIPGNRLAANGDQSDELTARFRHVWNHRDARTGRVVSPSVGPLQRFQSPARGAVTP